MRKSKTFTFEFDNSKFAKPINVIYTNDPNFNMNSFSTKEICKLYGRPYATTVKHIAALIKKKKFKKKSPGRYYNLEEYKQLCELLCITEKKK